MARGLAVVTGGARGLGRGIGQALLDRKVVSKVVALDLDLDTGSGGFASGAIHCDVQDEESVRAAFESLGEIPKVLVNNAGGSRPDGGAGGSRPDGGAGGSRPDGGAGGSRPDVGAGGPVEEVAAEPFDPFGPVEAWRASVDLNLTAAHVVTRVIGPHLESGAAICNVASIAGQTANALFAYAAAKAGVIHWTKCLALALAPRGIRVNAVAPGFIYTRAWQQLAPDRAVFDAVVGARVPLGAEQTAGDIGEAVAFLCSRDAAQITGQCLAIDGGATLGQPLVGIRPGGGSE